MNAFSLRQHIYGGARGVTSPLALSSLCSQLSSSYKLTDKSKFEAKKQFYFITNDIKKQRDIIYFLKNVKFDIEMYHASLYNDK